MKFIGGPLHGQSVPEQLLAVEVAPLYLQVEILNGDGSVTSMSYIRLEWFVAPGRPMIPFYGMMGEQIDRLIEIGRKVMTPC